MRSLSRTSLALVCQQINRDNPDLKTELTADNVMVLGGPYTTSLGNSGRNARIIMNGKTGSGIVNKKEFFYDRLNIAQLFNGITVVFNAAGDSKTIGDLLPALNQQYGLGLTTDDITNASTKLGTGYVPTEVTINIAAASLAYVGGSLKVIWTRTPVGTFPDSGPGSKVMLVGSMEEGYFGTVSEDELFNAASILSKLNEGDPNPAGTLSNLPTERMWYKFARDNKILYLASYNHIAIKWQDLYVRGAVYESDIPTDKQIPPTDVSPVTQHLAMRKIENGREWYLSPCMPRLSDETEWDYAAANQTPDPTGDVSRLFAKIAKSGGFATSEWDVIGIDAGGFWMSTTSKANPAMAFGTNMVGINQGTYDKKTYNGGWRPMLELIDPAKIVLPLENFVGTASGALRKPLVSIDPDTGEVLLIVSEVAWEIQGALNKPLVSFEPVPLLATERFHWMTDGELPRALVSFETSPLLNAKYFYWQTPLRAPVVQVTSEYKEVIPVSLADCNSELDGF